MLSHTTPGTQPDISNFNGECKIDETAEKYLNKIIELCKENRIELCFIISPFYGISKDFCMQINHVTLYSFHWFPLNDIKTSAFSLSQAATQSFKSSVCNKSKYSFARWK